jgi:outer membrane protein OmpA-like peptidoglycan-associated protein
MKRGGIGFSLLGGVVLLSLVMSGCFASKRVNNCIAGAIVGAGVGAAIGAGTGGNNHEHSDNAMLGAGIGAVVGGLAGCLLTKEEAPAPPPPPPPPPPPAPAPRAAEPPPAPKKIVLRGVNFDYDKSNIKAEFAPVLDEAAQILTDNPSVNVAIEGHTDSIGSDGYNQRLSERRAQAVKQYLVSKGVSAGRLTTIGKGEKEPIAPNTTPDGKDNPDGRAMNRRAELKVQ